MFVKKLITVCLLLFVGVTVGVLAAKGFRGSDGASEKLSAGTGEAVQEAAAVQDGMVAYYFHGDFRCPTCRTIESYAHDAIEAGFAQELDTGTVQWRVLNYDHPESRSLVERYRIVAPIVILSQVKDGTETSWSSLDKVWQLTDDKAEFVKYVQEEAGKLLADATG